jgi:hypothetical protein
VGSASVAVGQASGTPLVPLLPESVPWVVLALVPWVVEPEPVGEPELPCVVAPEPVGEPELPRVVVPVVLGEPVVPCVVLPLPAVEVACPPLPPLLEPSSLPLHPSIAAAHKAHPSVIVRMSTSGR